jgi:site-specific DNA recombinase
LESLVVDRLRTFLADQGALLDAIRDETTQDVGQLIERGRQIADSLQIQEPDAVNATLMTLLSRVEIGSSCVEIKLSRPRLADLLAGQSMDPTNPPQIKAAANEDVVTLTVPARLKRVGREMRMLVENSDDQTPADLSLLRIIARAHDIHIRLTQNVDLTVHDVAREEHVSAAYVYSVLRLAGLAPEIVTAIINGRNPPQLTAKRLMRLSPHLPIDRVEQRKLLGFS